jgi:predicted lipoprotein with Yx(FWY)xxD motif
MHIPTPIRRLLPAGLAAAALIVAACGSPGNGSSATTSPPATSSAPSSTSAPASGSELKTKNVSGTTVLANSEGFTLYSFAPDSSTASKCTGGCATIWPPENGPATAGSGVTGKLGTITRADGSSQATYNGHPLYTYTADTGPGQTNGNGINTFGGVWHVVPVSGTAPTPSGSPTSGGGGY